jgi:hypothetical protein
MLAIGEVVPDNKDEMFEKFDMAFCSNHFGLDWCEDLPHIGARI